MHAPPSGCPGTHGAPSQTSIRLPPTRRNSDFWRRASGLFRGALCGSCPSRGGVFVIGGAGMPVSQSTIAEPPNGYAVMRGMPK